MTTADDPQASLLQQLLLLLRLLWRALTSNANFQGAREVFRPPLVGGQHHRRMHKAWYDQPRIEADIWMDARRILPPRSSGSRDERTPYPCNKPGLAASVPSLHHRSHQPASTLSSPQGLGYSMYQQTVGPSRRHRFTTSITYGANAGTEGGFLSPTFPKSSAHILTELAES